MDESEVSDSEEIMNEGGEQDDRSQQTEKSEKSEKSEKRKKKRQQKDKEKEKPQPGFVFNYDAIPGIVKIVLTAAQQKNFGIVVGTDVTNDNPWKNVPKEKFVANLKKLDKKSIFFKWKKELLKFPLPEVLMGYIVKEGREYDEFYLCTTEDACFQVHDLDRQYLEYLEQKLLDQIYRSIRPWKTMGSGPEVDENIVANNRPLIEVEVECEYPVFPAKVEFRLRPVEKARDGYIELLPGKVPIVNVIKKRIDRSTQVAPSVKPNEAQTICTYPKNAWTQYEFKCKMDTAPTVKFIKSIEHYMEKEMHILCDFIRVNSHINFYVNDYQNLIGNIKYTKIPKPNHFKEYMSFADTKVCKGKMISAVKWHPMWTGTLAIGYADLSPNIYTKGVPTLDEVNSTVHGVNPVLIWSFKDGLNPKLFLETQREVTALSFCPYNENILVGGCRNGQVVIWDIRNKLKYVEEEEILTNAQQQYRVLMFSLMKWMKNTQDLSVVRATVVSDLEYSHNGVVKSIKWIPAFGEVSKTGQFTEIPPNREETSLQFMTCGLDGRVLFWNLLAKPTVSAAAARSQKKSKRVVDRPDALTVDVSPFRVLNRVLKPHFRVDVVHPTQPRTIPLSILSIKSDKTYYVEVDTTPRKVLQITDRLLYKPVLSRTNSIGKCNFEVGSLEGDFIIAQWEGFDYNTGEVVNTQRAKIISLSKYHDGPVTALGRSKFFENLFLSVGGKVFCIWKEDFPSKPVFWRKIKTHSKYTHGVWSSTRPSKFRLTRTDGCVESWRLLIRSEMYEEQQCISAQTVTNSLTHPLNTVKNIIGIADYNGSFRIFIAPGISKNKEAAEGIFMREMMDRELSRKTAFYKWQEEWAAKNQAVIQQRNMRIEEALKKKAEMKELETLKKMEEKENAEMELAKSSEQVHPEPGQFEEWAKEQWNKKEEERMNKILLGKKKLDRDLLERQQLPLKKLALEEGQKRVKQEGRLQNADNIFNEAINMLFPDVIEKKPPPPLDPYSSTFDDDSKNSCYETYIDSLKTNEEFVRLHPYRYFFDWNQILIEGQERRKLLDRMYEQPNHKTRYMKYKIKREEDKAKRGKKSKAPKVEETASVDTEETVEESIG